jgi:hypothetical protein
MPAGLSGDNAQKGTNQEDKHSDRLHDREDIFPGENNSSYRYTKYSPGKKFTRKPSRKTGIIRIAGSSAGGVLHNPSALYSWRSPAPGERIVPVPPGADLRVLLPEGDGFTAMVEKLAAGGAQVRRVRYLLEQEAITRMSARAPMISLLRSVGSAG